MPLGARIDARDWLLLGVYLIDQAGDRLLVRGAKRTVKLRTRAENTWQRCKLDHAAAAAATSPEPVFFSSSSVQYTRTAVRIVGEFVRWR